MNAKTCACLHSILWCLLFLVCTGALAHVDVEKARAIHEAVIKEDWQNACELLCAVMQGKLSGSANPLAPNYCMVLIFKEKNVVDSGLCQDLKKTAFTVEEVQAKWNRCAGVDTL